MNEEAKQQQQKGVPTVCFHLYKIIGRTNQYILTEKRWMVAWEWVEGGRNGLQQGTTKLLGVICSLSWVWQQFYGYTYVEKHEIIHFKYV